MSKALLLLIYRSRLPTSTAGMAMLSMSELFASEAMDAVGRICLLGPYRFSALAPADELMDFAPCGPYYI